MLIFPSDNGQSFAVDHYFPATSVFLRKGVTAEKDDQQEEPRELLLDDEAVLPSGSVESSLTPLPRIMMLSSLYQEVIQYLTTHTVEDGGMLIGPRGHDIITHFLPDEHGHKTSASYKPNAGFFNDFVRQLNHLFLEADFPGGMTIQGMVHSHPSGCTRLSLPDLQFVKQTFGRPKNSQSGSPHMVMPIVCDGLFYPYVVFRDQPGVAHHAELILV